MAPGQSVPRQRARSVKGASRTRVRRTKSRSNLSAANVESPPENPADLHALRKARLEYLVKPPEERRRTMKYLGEVVGKVTVTKRDADVVRKAPEIRKRHKTTSVRKHSQKKDRAAVPRADEGDAEHVYRQKADVKSNPGDTSETEIASVVKDAHEPLRRAKTRSSVVTDDRGQREERRPLPRRQSEPLRRRNSDGIDIGASDRRPPAHSESQRPPMQKSVTSVLDRPSSTIQRSSTSARSRVEVPTASSNTATEHARKGSSIFSRLLPPNPTTTEKKISCLTCGSDDVPVSKSAKLACSHRMCHECLRRIFNMSVTDPAHMPPRCCTSEHIPLKHVDKLFDQNFKKTWNRKFQEYNTRNRIYCPARGCGEWIKPNHITTDHGRKVGKCKRCNTRVCGTCNNRMHISRECPKDPATLQFVEVAKEKGWQKCYRCKAMVELKEGCNHMTCRCTAEFCMVCGLKWKSCDCPWFNYENVDAHLGNPIRYQEELDRRRVQEQRDEMLARRMEVLGIDQDTGFVALGNQAGHHMNEDFVPLARNILTGNFRGARLAAEDLINGRMTGRENPLTGMPLPRDQTTRQLRQETHRRNEEVRQGTTRRQGGSIVGGRRRSPEERLAE